MTFKLNFEMNKSLSTFKDQLNHIIKSEIDKPYIKTEWKNNVLQIVVDKMGKSEIRIKFTDINEDICRIEEESRNISMMHKPFVGEVEKIVSNIFVNKLGAKNV